MFNNYTKDVKDAESFQAIMPRPAPKDNDEKIKYKAFLKKF